MVATFYLRIYMPISKRVNDGVMLNLGVKSHVLLRLNIFPMHKDNRILSKSRTCSWGPRQDILYEEGSG